MENYKPPRGLIWATLIVLLVLFGSTFLFSNAKHPDAIAINIHGQPTIGLAAAKVHVVAFEEPKCVNCRIFTDTVLPQIKKEFVDTNKITYTVIPVSFLPGSMPAAIALLCVYHQDPLYPNAELFFSYLDYMYRHEPGEGVDWANTDKLLEFAKESSPAINTIKLRKCIDTQSYRVQIEKNTAYGTKIMGGRIGTPSVYVNGVEVEELTYDNLKEMIEEALQREGIY